MSVDPAVVKKIEDGFQTLQVSDFLTLFKIEKKLFKNRKYGYDFLANNFL